MTRVQPFSHIDEAAMRRAGIPPTARHGRQTAYVVYGAVGSALPDPKHKPINFQDLPPENPNLLTARPTHTGLRPIPRAWMVRVPLSMPLAEYTATAQFELASIQVVTTSLQRLIEQASSNPAVRDHPQVPDLVRPILNALMGVSL